MLTPPIESTTTRRSFLQLPPSATRPLLLLVLLADTPVPSVKATHGDYHQIFTTLFRKSIQLAEMEVGGRRVHEGAERHELTVESFDVVRGEYPTKERLLEAQGLLITGSASSACLPTPWITTLVEFIAALPVVSPALKVFGICFGHQIVARAFGGEVVKNGSGWEIGVRRVGLSERGKEVLGGEEVAIHQMHQDHVPALPDGFESLGSTSVCPIQGMVRLLPSQGAFDPACISIITFQGHPEFSTDIVEKVIEVREKGGVFPAELAKASRGYAKESDEGVRIGRVFLKMMGA